MPATLPVKASIIPYPYKKCKLVNCPDGDTINAIIGGAKQRLRLFGIDTPEIDQPWGKASQDIVQKNLSVSDNGIFFVKLIDVDHYDRLVVEVFLGSKEEVYSFEGGFNLNEYLLSHGYAVAYRRWLGHHGRRSDYIPLETEARRARRGLWSQDEIILPKVWRKMKKQQKHVNIFT